ncbi:hypothetical protein Tco_0051656 [Tanacetum coccineum]
MASVAAKPCQGDSFEFYLIIGFPDGYPKETMGYYFYYPLENKIFVAQNVEFFENCLTLQEASVSDVGLELLQKDDTQPSENTSEQHNDVEHMDVDPYSEKVLVYRFERISQAPDRYGFYIDVKEHELGDLNGPPNYKVGLSDPLWIPQTCVNHFMDRHH